MRVLNALKASVASLMARVRAVFNGHCRSTKDHEILPERTDTNPGGLSYLQVSTVSKRPYVISLC